MTKKIIEKLNENEKFKSLRTNDQRFIENSIASFKGCYPVYVLIRNKNNESMFIELAIIKYVLVIKLTEHNLLDSDRSHTIKKCFGLASIALRDGVYGRLDMAKFQNAKKQDSRKIS